MDFDKISDAQKKDLAKCKTPEDYFAIAKNLGYELSESEMAQIGGGDDIEEWGKRPVCPNCGSHNVTVAYDGMLCHRCRDCGCEW